MNPKYAHLFTKDGRVNTASIRGDRLNSELRAEIEQQYPVYTKLSHKLRAIKNGGYFHCYVCGAITEPSANVNREKLYCSKACVNACPDRISRAKALYQTHRDKRTKTNQERYGADTPFDSPSVQAKVKPTIQAKYGVSNIAQLDEVKRKKEQTYQERYGVRNPSQAEQFKVKAFNTMVERYGGHYIGSTTASTLAQAKFHYVSSLGIDCTECEVANITIGHFHAPISKEMILAKLGRIPMSVELVKRNYTHAYPILHQYKLMNSRAMSSQHKIVSAWLDELNIDYITNSRKVIAPQELDIFIPSHNLAIELTSSPSLK